MMPKSPLSGSVGLTSSDLELVRTSSDQQIGMRFQNISIEQGAIINSAYIEFACDENGTTEATNLTFYGQAHNNALDIQRFQQQYQPPGKNQRVRCLEY